MGKIKAAVFRRGGEQLPYMKKTEEDGPKCRDYAKQVAWQKERYRTIRFHLLKEHDEKLKCIIEHANTNMTEWFRSIIDKEYQNMGD